MENKYLFFLNVVRSIFISKESLYFISGQVSEAKSPSPRSFYWGDDHTLKKSCLIIGSLQSELSFVILKDLKQDQGAHFMKKE
jgi:hypothetical protein